ncbi:MAG TPA: GAP family protein [Ornithinibacter sp.]|nr:GAP family protein [Ornithinibacter sp.]
MVVAGQGGRRDGAWYAAGTGLVLLGLVSAVAVIGQSLNLPRLPHLDARLDILVGLVLLAAAVTLTVRARRPDPEAGTIRMPSLGADGLGAARSLGFGMVSMCTNATTLPVMLVAVKDVIATGAPRPEQVLAVAVLLALATLPATIPLMLSLLPGGAGERLLQPLGTAVERYAKVGVRWILALVGVYLLVRGFLAHLALT